MKYLKIATSSGFSLILLYFIYTPTTTIMYSCGKFSPIDTIIKPFDSTKYNDSVMSFLDYQPTTFGSKWTYEAKVFGIISTYKVQCTDKDSTLPDSKVYRVFELDGGKKEFHKKKDTFQYWTNIPGSSVNNTMMALKSNAKVNETWYAGKNGTDTYTAEMIERLQEYKIDSNVYRNVLHIKISKNAPSGGGTDIYTAAGIGAIYVDGVPELKLIKAEIK